ncbi:MAG: ABC transporter permease [Methanosarcinales archaeon]|nr:ABC transporter permease [Methanosarcinales archaeon]
MRHIKSRRRQTLLAVGAVTLAVAFTIISRASINGFEEVLLSIVFKMVPHVVISPKDGEDYIYLYRTLVESLQATSGVIAVSPMLISAATLSHEDGVQNVALCGTLPRELDRMSGIGSQSMLAGDLDSIQGGLRIVISKEVAEDLDLKLGDGLEASFPDAHSMNLVVCGIFDTGVEWDELAFVSLETAREFVGEGDVVTEIQVKLQDIYQADSLVARIRSQGYRADSWQRLFPEILRTIRLESVSNSLIMSLILIISAFGIANVMNMLVLEKTGEIGMLMSMGASSRQVLRLFLLESGILGLSGGLLGCLLGYVSSLYLNSLNLAFSSPAGQTINLPFLIGLQDLAAYLTFALILSLAAGLYPARRASRLDPIEAMRS